MVVLGHCHELFWFWSSASAFLGGTRGIALGNGSNSEFLTSITTRKMGKGKRAQGGNTTYEIVIRDLAGGQLVDTLEQRYTPSVVTVDSAFCFASRLTATTTR